MEALAVGTHQVQRKETSIHRVEWHAAFQVGLTLSKEESDAS